MASRHRPGIRSDPACKLVPRMKEEGHHRCDEGDVVSVADGQDGGSPAG